MCLRNLRNLCVSKFLTKLNSINTPSCIQIVKLEYSTNKNKLRM